MVIGVPMYITQQKTKSRKFNETSKAIDPRLIVKRKLSKIRRKMREMLEAKAERRKYNLVRFKGI